MRYFIPWHFSLLHFSSDVDTCRFHRERFISLLIPFVNCCRLSSSSYKSFASISRLSLCAWHKSQALFVCALFFCWFYLYNIGVTQRLMRLVALTCFNVVLVEGRKKSTLFCRFFAEFVFTEDSFQDSVRLHGSKVRQSRKSDCRLVSRQVFPLSIQVIPNASKDFVPHHLGLNLIPINLFYRPWYLLWYFALFLLSQFTNVLFPYQFSLFKVAFLLAPCPYPTKHLCSHCCCWEKVNVTSKQKPRFIWQLSPRSFPDNEFMFGDCIIVSCSTLCFWAKGS